MSRVNRTRSPKCPSSTIFVSVIAGIFALSFGPTVSAQSELWEIEIVGHNPDLLTLTDRSLGMDGSGCLHVAYGENHLYHAWNQGSGWQIEMVDDAAPSGRYAALALDANDYLHVAYRITDRSSGGTTRDLKYAYKDGMGWHVETLDTDWGESVSIAVDEGGFPHISHCTGYTSRLTYTYKDETGWHSELVDTSLVARYGSVALGGDGTAHVSYYDHTSGDLRYAFREQGIWHTTNVDSAGDVGSHTSIALDVNGWPHISYHDHSNYDLKYACLTETGWSIVTPDALGEVGEFTSLVLDASGYPHISYYDNTNRDLKLAYKDSAVWHVLTIESEGEIGQYTSLALGSGSYHHAVCMRSLPMGPYSYLAVIHCYEDGSGWHSEIVDTQTGVSCASMALDDTCQPHVAYIENARARLMSAYRTSSGWLFEAADTNYVPYSSGIAGKTSIVIGPDGCTHIAYGRWHGPAGGGTACYLYRDGTGWHGEVLHSGYGAGVGTERGIALRPGGVPSISSKACDVYYNCWQNYSWKDTTWHIEGNIGGCCYNAASLAIDQNGRPHLAWAGGDLVYAHRDDSGWNVESVAAALGVWAHASLALDAWDSPHISYLGPVSRLCYAYKDETGWQTETVVDDVVGESTLSLDLLGNPNIAYRLGVDGGWADELWYAYRDGQGWHFHPVEGEGDVGADFSLVIDSEGRPHVVYLDEAGNDLKYGYLPFGPPWAPEIEVTPMTVEASAVEGETVQRSITVENSGTADLTYAVSVTMDSRKGKAPVVPYLELAKGETDPRTGETPERGSGGPDGFGYQWIDSDEPGGPAYSWVDISSSGTSPGSGDDSNYGPFGLGFTFPYYGTDYTQVRICTNGWLSFTSTGNEWTNQGIPNSEEPNGVIAPFWDDMDPSEGGSLRYLSDVGNGRFIVQWTNVPRYQYPSGTGSYTFQVILYANGRIVYQYNNLVGDVNYCTVGIEDQTGTDGLQVVFNAAYLHNGLAIEFRLPWLVVAPVSGAVSPGGNAELTVTLDATNLSEGTYTGTITITSNDADESSIQIPVTFHVEAVLVPELTVASVGGSLELTWSPVPQAAAYWVYGASNAPHFEAGMEPGYANRVAVLPTGTTSWSSPSGVGDPDDNWTYLVMAVNGSGVELCRSNRGGEIDYESDIP